MGLFVRRGAAWAVDYLINAGLVSVFLFCARVFYLRESTRQQGDLMLVCAVVALVLLTVALPRRWGGRSIGEHLAGIEFASRSGAPRSTGQIALHKCVLKVALGPFLAVFCLLDYVVICLLVHRDPYPDLIVDFFLKVRCRSAGHRDARDPFRA